MQSKALATDEPSDAETGDVDSGPKDSESGVFRKRVWQLKILNVFFKDINRKITDELRFEACRKTGLKWNKIYKWVFDKRNVFRARAIKKDTAPAPIFIINKVDRKSAYPKKLRL